MIKKMYPVVVTIISFVVIIIPLTMLHSNPKPVAQTGAHTLNFHDSAITVIPESIYLYKSTNLKGDSIPILHANITMRPYYYFTCPNGKIIKINEPTPIGITKLTVILFEDKYTKYRYTLYFNDTTYQTDKYLENDTYQSIKYIKEHNMSTTKYSYYDGILSVDLNLLKMNMSGHARLININGDFGITVEGQLEQPLHYMDGTEDVEGTEYIEQIAGCWPQEVGRTSYPWQPDPIELY